jgi:hypothetical protein
MEGMNSKYKHATGFPWLIALVIASAPVAGAAVVTFDSFTLASHTNSFTEGGWVFTATTSGSGNVNLAVEAAGLQGGGADRVVSFGVPFSPGNPVIRVTIGQTGATPFKLESFSLAEGGGNTNIRIEGFRGGVSAGYAAVQFNSALDADGVVPVAFAGWDHLDEIRITNFSGSPDLGFDIDDLTYTTAIPEVSTLGLVAFAAVGICRRRR